MPIPDRIPDVIFTNISDVPSVPGVRKGEMVWFATILADITLPDLAPDDLLRSDTDAGRLLSCAINVLRDDTVSEFAFVWVDPQDLVNVVTIEMPRDMSQSILARLPAAPIVFVKRAASGARARFQVAPLPGAAVVGLQAILANAVKSTAARQVDA